MKQRTALATIIPPPSEPGQYTRTQGTKVELPDGTQLGGVMRIELLGERNDMWRARIDCMVNVQLMPGMALQIRHPGRTLGFWRRLCLRAAGVSALDVTTLEQERYAQWAAIDRISKDAIQSGNASPDPVEGAGAPGADESAAAAADASSAADEQPRVESDTR